MTSNLSRRRFLKDGARATLGVALIPPPTLWRMPTFDVVIRGGTVLDGTGGAAFPADIGIVGEEIRGVGAIDPGRGRRALDASGLHVAPGFIDIHTHSDGDILRYPDAESRVMQGVTTEVTGNCGGSVAPRTRDRPGALPRELAEEYGVGGTWTDVASYFELLQEVGIAVNHTLLLGQGTLRENVVGSRNRPLTSQERTEVLRNLEEGLDQGAVGLSTGLEYVPGRFTPTAEIAEMARVVARRGGLYASHIRNEESAVLEAIDEAIRIGRRTGVRVEVAHLKVAGLPNWGKQAAALHLLEGARADGVDVMADAYPYTAYSTGISIFLPAWAADGGREALLQRLADSTDRPRIRAALSDRIRQDPGGFDLIVISRIPSETNRWAVGRNLVEVGEEWKLEPVDALLRLMEEETGVGFIGHGMSPENVERVLGHPLVVIGSDGSSMAPRGNAVLSRPHPRSYGTFARVLGEYCRERGLMSLAGAVRKMTSMPADQTGITDRGRIARGMKADLVVFDAASVQDRATFEDPHRYPTGVHHVLVNGVAVVESGVHTGARRGSVLR